MFAENNGPSVPEHGEIPELMTGIGLGKRFGSFGDEVAGKEFGPFFFVHAREVQADLIGEFVVEDHEFRLTDRRRGEF